MANTDKRKKHITAGEIITVIAVVLCLAAGLVFSLMYFSEQSVLYSVEKGAMETYSAVTALNIKVEDLSSAKERPEIIKETFPDIFEFGTNEESVINSARDGKMKNGQYAVSNVGRSAMGFTFTYYSLNNGKLYKVQYTDGVCSDVEVIFESK